MGFEVYKWLSFLVIWSLYFGAFVIENFSSFKHFGLSPIRILGFLSAPISNRQALPTTDPLHLQVFELRCATCLGRGWGGFQLPPVL